MDGRTPGPGANAPVQVLKHDRTCAGLTPTGEKLQGGRAKSLVGKKLTLQHYPRFWDVSEHSFFLPLSPSI